MQTATKDSFRRKDGGPLRCLVVDDEPRLRHVLSQLMRRMGFECREAVNGLDALAILEAQPFELMTTDMRMPGMDGMDLLTQVHQRWPDTAVVMVTAVVDVQLAVHCLSGGAMDYLTKPFHLEEVEARVKQVLERRRLILENRDHQVELERRVAEQAQRIERMYLAGMQALADALELKDPYTRGHSIRVSAYSSAIARTMELDDETIRQIELGGHLHDIGKIGVREAVLNKPGRLTDEEYRHIMEHPVLGWRILGPLLGDSPIVLNVVRSHHERVDGTGVPDGLVGDRIPIEARIAAVADALDAMMSGRPYHDSERQLGDALAELVAFSGRQFDRKVVNATLHAIDSGLLAIVPRYAQGSALSVVA